ncbi:hypothetical protein ACIQUQ_07835 [Streptomyces sp. NPDC101118]|uniref:hypothetical protein n=1 Tax=Streptomyces sp. NPDC101118 TaxID=3366109 RepID=UPI0037FCE683
MPGQRKRKRSRERELRRAEAARTPGRWERVFHAPSYAECREYAIRLAGERPELADPALLRFDMFCGRLQHPTTYALSVFVPDPPAAPDCTETPQSPEA